jgi:hypothetical protein
MLTQMALPAMICIHKSHCWNVFIVLRFTVFRPAYCNISDRIVHLHASRVVTSVMADMTRKRLSVYVMLHAGVLLT